MAAGVLTENGFIDSTYRLSEVQGSFSSEKENYNKRTMLNIRDSDGTLIIIPKTPIPAYITDGTVLTIKYCQNSRKPFFFIVLSRTMDFQITKFHNFIKKNNISILNIAGPRESTCPGIFKVSLELIKRLIMT